MNSSETEPLAPVYVLDTHVLIWALTNNRKLDAHGRMIFKASEQYGEPELVIPAIVIAEMYWVNKKYKLFADFGQVYADLKVRPYIRLVDFRAEDVLSFAELESIPDMHDRMIVGVAKRLGALLITADEKIVAAGLVKTVQIVW